MSKPTEAEIIEHYKIGVGRKCLVCDDEELTGTWTDYNGQIRCWNCGMTYQILGSHLKEEWLKKHDLTKDDIAERYCDEFSLVPLCRDYWQEVHKRVPFG